MTRFRPSPSYKPSGVQWLGDVPAGWDVLPGRACYREKCTPNKGMLEKTVLSLSFGRIVVKPPEKLHGLVPASFETYQVVEPGDIVCRPTDLQNDWEQPALRVRGDKRHHYVSLHEPERPTRYHASVRLFAAAYL